MQILHHSDESVNKYPYLVIVILKLEICQLKDISITLKVFYIKKLHIAVSHKPVITK